MRPETITESLYQQIPIVKTMGLSISHYDGQSLRIAAPLAVNLNHHETAFGGSIATVAITTGWTMLDLMLKEALSPEEPVRLLIQKMSLEYLRPIDADFEGVCTRPSDVLIESIKTRRKGRCTIRVEIQSRGFVCAIMEATYVALKI